MFTFSGPSGANSIPLSISGTHTVTAHADWSVDGGSQADLTQTNTCEGPPQCPPKTLNFRWHYSANGTSGSWSATKSTTCPGSITIGPQAMEGDLKVSPERP